MLAQRLRRAALCSLLPLLILASSAALLGWWCQRAAATTSPGRCHIPSNSAATSA